jgi:hypothetical protein
VTRQGADIPLVPFRDDLDLRTLPDNVLVTADTETPMRAAVEINYVFGLPMPVIDKVGAADRGCGHLRNFQRCPAGRCGMIPGDGN